MKICLKKYVGADGNIIKPIPVELFQTKEATRSVLFQLDAIICPRTGKGPVRGWFQDPATTALTRAFNTDCLAGDEIAEILNRKINYRGIFKHVCFLCGESEAGVGHEAQFINTLLFILELYQPQIDRLRKERVKYEMTHHFKIPKDKYHTSPQQIVASWGWEKKVRNAKRFKACSKWIIKHMKDKYGAKAPYWIFALATFCRDVDYNFFAFDSCYRFLPELSDEIAGDIRERGDTEITHSYQQNYLYDLCWEYNLEMVGTPFISPPLNDELHIYAQQISVSQRQNAIEVRIPAFYTLNHLVTLLEKDFGDLKKAIVSSTFLNKITNVRMPDIKTSPLSDEEMGAGAKVVRKVLEQCYQLSKYKSFLYAATTLSYWWGMPSQNIISTRIIRLIKQPTKLTPGERGKQILIPKKWKIIEMVRAKINKCKVSGDELYAWYKFYKAAYEKEIAPTDNIKKTKIKTNSTKK